MRDKSAPPASLSLLLCLAPEGEGAAEALATCIFGARARAVAEAVAGDTATASALLRDETYRAAPPPRRPTEATTFLSPSRARHPKGMQSPAAANSGRRQYGSPEVAPTTFVAPPLFGAGAPMDGPTLHDEVARVIDMQRTRIGALTAELERAEAERAAAVARAAAAEAVALEAQAAAQRHARSTQRRHPADSATNASRGRRSSPGVVRKFNLHELADPELSAVDLDNDGDAETRNDNSVDATTAVLRQFRNRSDVAAAAAADVGAVHHESLGNSTRDSTLRVQFEGSSQRQRRGRDADSYHDERKERDEPMTRTPGSARRVRTGGQSRKAPPPDADAAPPAAPSPLRSGSPLSEAILRQLRQLLADEGLTKPDYVVASEVRPRGVEGSDDYDMMVRPDRTDRPHRETTSMQRDGGREVRRIELEAPQLRPPRQSQRQHSQSQEYHSVRAEHGDVSDDAKAAMLQSRGHVLDASTTALTNAPESAVRASMASARLAASSISSPSRLNSSPRGATRPQPPSPASQAAASAILAGFESLTPPRSAARSDDNDMRQPPISESSAVLQPAETPMQPTVPPAPTPAPLDVDALAAALGRSVSAGVAAQVEAATRELETHLSEAAAAREAQWAQATRGLEAQIAALRAAVSNVVETAATAHPLTPLAVDDSANNKRAPGGMVRTDNQFVALNQATAVSSARTVARGSTESSVSTLPASSSSLPQSSVDVLAAMQPPAVDAPRGRTATPPAAAAAPSPQHLFSSPVATHRRDDGGVGIMTAAYVSPPSPLSPLDLHWRPTATAVSSARQPIVVDGDTRLASTPTLAQLRPHQLPVPAPASDSDIKQPRTTPSLPLGRGSSVGATPVGAVELPWWTVTASDTTASKATPKGMVATTTHEVRSAAGPLASGTAVYVQRPQISAPVVTPAARLPSPLAASAPTTTSTSSHDDEELTAALISTREALARALRTVSGAVPAPSMRSGGPTNGSPASASGRSLNGRMY